MARLDQHFARFFAAAGAARHLRHLLVGPLGRAQVAAFEAEIGIDHADQCQLGKVESLSHELRADDYVDRLRLDLRHERGGFLG
jgi:hypothetical protein